jgi:hypothetical protein
MKRKHLIIPTLLVLVLLAAVTAPLLAQSGNSWFVQYYNSSNWSNPSVSMYSAYIDFNWGTTPPAPGMPADNWTATMTSTAYFYTGSYVFSALADDEISVQIDGVTYINTIGAGMSGKPVQIAVPMTQGNHNLVVQYRQYTGGAYVYLNWAYMNPSGTPIYTPMPAPPPAGTPACNPWWSCACPVQATSVTTEYGNYTPCIQQNLQQASCFVSNGQWDAPNMGSIQAEPQIQVWGNCTPGQLQCMQLACNQAPVEATCSKTGAGWFYYGPCSGPTPTPPP